MSRQLVSTLLILQLAFDPFVAARAHPNTPQSDAFSSQALVLPTYQEALRIKQRAIAFFRSTPAASLPAIQFSSTDATATMYATEYYVRNLTSFMSSWRHLQEIGVTLPGLTPEQVVEYEGLLFKPQDKRMRELHQQFETRAFDRDFFDTLVNLLLHTDFRVREHAQRMLNVLGSTPSQIWSGYRQQASRYFPIADTRIRKGLISEAIRLFEAHYEFPLSSRERSVVESFALGEITANAALAQLHTCSPREAAILLALVGTLVHVAPQDDLISLFELYLDRKGIFIEFNETSSFEKLTSRIWAPLAGEDIEAYKKWLLPLYELRIQPRNRVMPSESELLRLVQIIQRSLTIRRVRTDDLLSVARMADAGISDYLYSRIAPNVSPHEIWVVTTLLLRRAVEDQRVQPLLQNMFSPYTAIRVSARRLLQRYSLRFPEFLGEFSRLLVRHLSNVRKLSRVPRKGSRVIVVVLDDFQLINQPQSASHGNLVLTRIRTLLKGRKDIEIRPMQFRTTSLREIEDLVDANADASVVINMSFTSRSDVYPIRGSDDPLLVNGFLNEAWIQTMRAKGAVFCIAAGNGEKGIKGGAPILRTHLDHDHVAYAGAGDETTFLKHPYSNTGPHPNFIGLVPTGDVRGTSLAAATLSAVVAGMLADDPVLSSTDVFDRLRRTAERVNEPEFDDGFLGAGLVGARVLRTSL